MGSIILIAFITLISARKSSTNRLPTDANKPLTHLPINPASANDPTSGSFRIDEDLVEKNLSGQFYPALAAADIPIEPVPLTNAFTFTPKQATEHALDKSRADESHLIPAPANVPLTEDLSNYPDKVSVNGVHTAEFILDEGSTDEPYAIPNRVDISPSKDPIDSSLDFYSYGSGTSFLKDAQKYVDKVEVATPHKPFETYYSTYRDMDAAQKRWYFYWRDQYRSGNALHTDLSYLFVYVYECIHVVGFTRPADALRQLLGLWTSYGETYPKLGWYLQSWTLDMVAYYQLETDPLELVWTLSQAGVRSYNHDLVLAAHLKHRPATEVPLSLIFAFSGFDPKSTKFYREYADTARIEDCYRKAIEVVNAYYLKTTEQDMFQGCHSKKKRKIKSQAFSGAVFGYQTREVVVAEIYSYTANAELSGILKSSLKLSENLLRKQVGFSGARRDISLPAALETQLMEEWERNTKLPLTKPASRRAVTVDLSKISDLQLESQKIRAQLISDTDTTEIPPDYPAALPFAQLADIPFKVDPSAPVSVGARVEIGAISTVSNLPELAHSSPNRALNGLALGWSDFLSALTPLHVAALNKLIPGCSRSELESFAAKRFTMSELLIEEINEKAMDTLGDAVIDPYEELIGIYDEHQENTRLLLNQVQEAA